MGGPGERHAVAGRASLDGYWLASADGNSHIDALSTTLTDFGKHARYASASATELRDADTAAIFTEIAASTHGSGSSRRASNQAIEHS